MALVLLTTSVNTALAVTVNTDHQYAGGNSVIDVPGQTRISLVVGRMEGDYYSGKADRIQIAVDTGTLLPNGLPRFKGVASYEDNPTRHAFSEGLGTSGVKTLVKPGHIQVLRIGKTNDVIIHWTIPLVAPATTAPYPTPEVTLPPGKLVLRGYGDAFSGYVIPMPIGTTGWTVEINTPSIYLASATLFCQGWNYKWKPVAENFFGTAFEPKSVTDRTWTWTGP